jgi:hypothetical protein
VKISRRSDGISPPSSWSKYKPSRKSGIKQSLCLRLYREDECCMFFRDASSLS